MIKKELTKFMKMYLTGRRRRGRTQKGYILFLQRIHLPSLLRDVCFNVKILVVKRAKDLKRSIQILRSSNNSLNSTRTKQFIETNKEAQKENKEAINLSRANM